MTPHEEGASSKQMQSYDTYIQACTAIDIHLLYYLVIYIYIYIYIYVYIQRITMCPHGCHHSGSMATPALGTRDVRLHIVWIAL